MTGQAYGLIRDKHGKPRFDNIKGIPLPLWGMLSLEEQEEIRANGGYPSGGERPTGDDQPRSESAQ